MSLHRGHWESLNDNEDVKNFSQEIVRHMINLLEDFIDTDDRQLVERVIAILQDPDEYEQQLYNIDEDDDQFVNENE